MSDWTPEEDEKLASLYADRWKTIDDMKKELPGRTENAIRLRASRTGLKRPLLAEPEDDTLPQWVREALTD